MDRTLYLKRKNFGRHHFGHLAGEIQKEGITIVCREFFDIQDIEDIRKQAKGRNFRIDGNNVFAKSKLKQGVKIKFPKLYELINSLENLIVILDSSGDYIGAWKLHAEDNIEAIILLCEIDENGVTITNERKELIALFDYELENKTISVLF